MPSLTFPTVTCLRMPEQAGQPVPEKALPDVLRGAAEAGFGQVGLDGFTLAAFDGDPVPLLREYGLSCTDVGVLRIGSSGETLRSADTIAELGERLGARFCVTAFDVLDAQLAATCAERLAGAGIRLAVEFLPYTPLATLAQARQLCDEVGWDRCGLLADSWMFFHGDNSWAELEALTHEQIAYVQLDDAPEPIGPDVVFESRHRRVLPGEGVLDLVRFTAALDRVGFSGPVAVEVLNPRFRALHPAEQGRAARAAARAVWPALDEGVHS